MSTLTVGREAFRAIRWLPTESNTRVAVCRAGDGREVVVKMALADRHVLDSGISELTELQAQVRHLRALQAMVTDPDLYPEILASDDRAFVMPYYPQGALEEWLGEGRAAARPLLAAALEQLFHVSQLGRRIPDPPDVAAFLGQQMEMRVDRLRHAVAATEAGQRFAAARPAWEAELRRIEGWLDRCSEPVLGRLALLPLGLAAHGDLVPGNVLVRSAEPASVVFIDVRGRAVWKHGLPWWDPVMDVAALMAQLLTAQALAPWEPSPARALHAVTAPEVPLLGLELPALARWARTDADWQERLELYVVLKLLGKVAFQLVYPPSHQVDRAAAVWELARSLTSAPAPGRAAP
jgi:hypothetical protein